MGRISPIVLLVIVILAVIFFIFGLLHLLIRCLMKRPSFSPISQSNRLAGTSGRHSLQGQLQQLFLLHDSGLDQAVIDALPLFYYKDIRGLQEPFDCAVCLCEFSEEDKLRLLPMCSHAFHISCIDTWLLSNSTCPLCRGLISSSGLPLMNPLFNFEEPREQQNCFPSEFENKFCCSQKPDAMRENNGEMRIFSVRLGKFRNVNLGVEHGDSHRIQGEISSCSLDARRCYSMGSFQYVFHDSDLQVVLLNVNGHGGNDLRSDKNATAPSAEREGKKISARTRGESYSVSKIWLWSKNPKFSDSSDTNVDKTSCSVNSMNA